MNLAIPQNLLVSYQYPIDSVARNDVFQSQDMKNVIMCMTG